MKEKIAEKLEHYFASNQFNDDLKLTITKYCIDRCMLYLEENLVDFMKSLKTLHSWLHNNFLQIRETVFVQDLTDRSLHDELYKRLSFRISHSIDIPRKKLSHITVSQKQLIRKESKIQLSSLSKIIISISTLDVIEAFLFQEQNRIADLIDQGRFPGDELKTIAHLKKLDILRNVFLIEKGVIFYEKSFDKNKHYEMLTERFDNLNRDNLCAWNNIYSNFSRKEILQPIRFIVPSPLKGPEYDFLDYINVPYIIYCRDIAEEKKKTTFVDFMLNRTIGEGMSYKDQKILNDFLKYNPQRYAEVFDQVHNEQLIKYEKYVALTSLVSMLDPLLKGICAQLNKKYPIQISIHKYKISSTYSSFKSIYRKQNDSNFLEYEQLIILLDQLYAKDIGHIRNAILHLDGIDLYTPSYYFEELYGFIRHVYESLAAFARQENLSLEPDCSDDKLSKEDENFVARYKNGFHWYVISGILYSNLILYLQRFLFSEDSDALYFFVSDRHSIEFLEENWDLIYPEIQQYKNDIIDLYKNIKIACQDLTISGTPIEYTDDEVIEGLKKIDCSIIIDKVKHTVREITNIITSNIFELCPAFSHLIKIGTQAVRATDTHESMLHLTVCSLLIEKVLIHLKQFLQLPNCVVATGYKNEFYIIKYRNMEVSNPKNSFIDEQFLLASYKILNNKYSEIDTTHYGEYKHLLRVSENIRNICAHGGVINFDENFAAVSSFIFFVIYRLVPLQLK